jgi:translation initiation factor 3 subunit A
MDVDDILARQVEQLEKEKKEMQEKLKVQLKKVSCNKMYKMCI